MTKLEQVARAIGRSRGDFSDTSGWIDDETHEHYLEDARAAVEALREPSEAMTEAGSDSFDWDSSDANGKYFIRDADPKLCWQAMCDAILSEKPE